MHGHKDLNDCVAYAMSAGEGTLLAYGVVYAGALPNCDLADDEDDRIMVIAAPAHLFPETGDGEENYIS